MPLNRKFSPAAQCCMLRRYAAGCHAECWLWARMLSTPDWDHVTALVNIVGLACACTIVCHTRCGKCTRGAQPSLAQGCLAISMAMSMQG